MAETHPDLFQAAVGYQFRNLQFLLEALTHSSYAQESADRPRDNEQMEFLGDAVLDFIVGEWLFRRFPEFAEGRLTSIRSATVRMETLSEIAGQLGLGGIQ